MSQARAATQTRYFEEGVTDLIVELPLAKKLQDVAKAVAFLSAHPDVDALRFTHTVPVPFAVNILRAFASEDHPLSALDLALLRVSTSDEKLTAGSNMEALLETLPHIPRLHDLKFPGSIKNGQIVEALARLQLASLDLTVEARGLNAKMIYPALSTMAPHLLRLQLDAISANPAALAKAISALQKLQWLSLVIYADNLQNAWPLLRAVPSLPSLQTLQVLWAIDEPPTEEEKMEWGPKLAVEWKQMGPTLTALDLLANPLEATGLHLVLSALVPFHRLRVFACDVSVDEGPGDDITLTASRIIHGLPLLELLNLRGVGRAPNWLLFSSFIHLCAALAERASTLSTLILDRFFTNIVTRDYNPVLALLPTLHALHRLQVLVWEFDVPALFLSNQNATFATALSGDVDAKAAASAVQALHLLPPSITHLALPLPNTANVHNWHADLAPLTHLAVQTLLGALPRLEQIDIVSVWRQSHLHNPQENTADIAQIQSEFISRPRVHLELHSVSLESVSESLLNRIFRW